jgi:hypothetical protein
VITLTLKIFTYAKGTSQELVGSLSEWKLENPSENEKVFALSVNCALKEMELLVASAAAGGTIIEGSDIKSATKAAFEREVKKLI